MCFCLSCGKDNEKYRKKGYFWLFFEGVIHFIAYFCTVKTYPLSHSQMGIVLACARQPESTNYNLPSAIPFPKEVDSDKLALAVREIVRCRPVLRTRLIMTERGIPRQYADEETEVPVPVRRMTESEAFNHIHDGFVRPFILFGPHPLCRFEVVETETHHWLLSDFHHIIADGITIAHCFMGRDLPAAYAGKPLGDSDLLLYEQAEEEERQTSTSDYQTAKAYHHELFSDVEFTALPSTASDEPGNGVIVSERIRRASVDAWCETHHATPNQLLMGAFCIVLSKLCHTSRVAFATLSHGRNRKCRDAYGMFVKTVPMVSEMEADSSVLDYVHGLRPLLTASMRHAAYPYTHFCRDLHKSAEATFAFQGNDILERVTVGGASVKGIQLSKGVAGSGLGCVVYASDQEYEIRVDASGATHGKATLEMFARCLTLCVEQMLQHPHLAIKDVELVDEKERADIIRLSQGEPMPYDTSKTFLDLWLEQARRTPDALAVSDGSETMTYAQLERSTSDVAHWLVGQGVGRGDFVGVAAIPCCGFLTAAIGTMGSGAAYVPLDPSWPEAYREGIVAEARLKATLDPMHLPHPGTGSGVRLPVAIPDDTAYMIFTSGTTGRAKGVMIPHRALTNLLHFIVRRWHLDETSRISCHSSLAFDASVEDLFPVLTAGGSVHLMPEEVRHDMDKLHQFLDDHHITGGCYTTQMGALIASRPHPTLDYICLGGEQLTEVPQAACHVYNTYGPTECCVDATYFELERGRTYATIPIGRPLDNTAAYVVDHHGRLLPQGAVGELCLSGSQLATGYWHDPELTQKRFTPSDSRETSDPRETCGPRKTCAHLLYHTGDLARWNPEWQLEYMGRMDHLVKVNGYRVSLDEVERLVALLPHVTSACVVMVSHQGRDQLCAYYTSEQAMDAKALMQVMREKAPSYMVPTCWMLLEQLPLLPNGKTDRKHLPVPDLSSSHSSAIPLTHLQRVVCEAFCQVLQCEGVGIDDDFFVLGGSSLTAMNLMTVLGEAGCKVEYGWVFQYSTPRLLAQAMTREQTTNLYPIEGMGSDGDDGENGINGVNGDCASGGLLLTGGTGFLGIHVLHEYLECEEGDVCCIVRGSTPADAWERLLDTYAYYFGKPPTEEQLERLDVVAGDLTDNVVLTLLQGRDVSKVINCAADVRHFAPQKELRAVNTDAVSRLAAFCHDHHALLVQVSTLGIAGYHDALSGAAPTLTEHDLYIGQQLHDPYTHSKFMAERLVLEAVAKGRIDARIIRVGHLSPRTTDGRFQRNAETNSLAMALQLCRLLRMVPASAATLSISLIPVDLAAKAILRLAGMEDLKDPKDPKDLKDLKIFHLALPDAPTFLDLLQSRCPSDQADLSDLAFRVVDDQVFMEAAEKAAADNPMRGMVLSAVAHLSVAEGHRPNLIECSLSAEVLRQLGLEW